MEPTDKLSGARTAVAVTGTEDERLGQVVIRLTEDEIVETRPASSASLHYSAKGLAGVTVRWGDE